MPDSSARDLKPLTVARLARRDGGRRCWHCWEEVAVGVQHRAAKGMGGYVAAERLSNGLILCNLLNSAAEADQDAAEMCLAYGWKVSKWDDPATVPALEVATGYWWLLDDIGGRRRVA